MSRKHWLTGVFAVLAFAQTLAYYIFLRDDPGNYNGAGASGDQVAYIDLAQQVLHGTWQGAVHYMPGLPAVIALGQVLTGDPRLGIALIHGVLYAVIVAVAARVAATTWGEHTRLWAAGAVAMNPALGYYAAQALTEFLTGFVLLCSVVAVHAWSHAPRLRMVALAGVLVGAAGYLRSEYLGLAVVFGLLVLWLGRSWRPAAVLVLATVLTMTPWVARYTVVTGSPALYNESPFSNLVLMGTWFRVFDERTFAQLQQIETAPGPREQAIERASTVGPRPELSQRYMEQARGPYERPLAETLSLAFDNVRLNLRQYAVNHLLLAPVLIWAGRTPVRQADVGSVPSSARYVLWAAELALVLLALWEAVRGLRARDRRALSASFLAVVLFLTAVHVVIAVDERFTTPALPLVGLFAGARLAELGALRRAVPVRRYAA
jgi:4-amino-4-deoxy-L-arabinose transferase-like glycosyltransferase